MDQKYRGRAQPFHTINSLRRQPALQAQMLVQYLSAITCMSVPEAHSCRFPAKSSDTRLAMAPPALRDHRSLAASSARSLPTTVFRICGLQRFSSYRRLQLPDAAVLLGFRRGSASPPKCAFASVPLSFSSDKTDSERFRTAGSSPTRSHSLRLPPRSATSLPGSDLRVESCLWRLHWRPILPN